MRRWLDRLLELRVREARERGLFDALRTRGRPIPKDPLSSLPAEKRAEARLTRTLGVAPDEVRMRREITRLSAELATQASPERRAALRHALRDRRIELSLLLERTGRAHLVERFVYGAAPN